MLVQQLGFRLGVAGSNLSPRYSTGILPWRIEGHVLGWSCKAVSFVGKHVNWTGLLFLRMAATILIALRFVYARIVGPWPISSGALI